MTMITKMYDSYYDPDTDPQLIVALKITACRNTKTVFHVAICLSKRMVFCHIDVFVVLFCLNWRKS
jgi:hypothetical protein